MLSAVETLGNSHVEIQLLPRVCQAQFLELVEFWWHTVFRAHPVFLKPLSDIYIFRKEYSGHFSHVPPRFPLLSSISFRFQGGWMSST